MKKILTVLLAFALVSGFLIENSQARRYSTDTCLKRARHVYNVEIKRCRKYRYEKVKKKCRMRALHKLNKTRRACKGRR